MKKIIILLLFIPLVFSCSSGGEEESVKGPYTLTVVINPSDGGVVNPNGGTVNAGDQIALTATPNKNFHFKDWTGAASGNANPVTIIMDANKTVTANFVKIFIIESNGRLRCPNANPGDTETINGKKYIAVDNKTDLQNYVWNNLYDSSCICTTLMTDMRELFKSPNYTTELTKDLSSWDVSNVTDMRGMFYRMKFNGDISNWNVGKVTTMLGMFRESPTFNQNLNSWNVSNVTDMGQMFYATKSFNGNISSWDVSKVTNMSGMFRAEAFNQDISNWDVSKVTTMNQMFSGAAAFNQNLNKWDVSNVTDMSEMFHTRTFNGDISNWNVGKVTTMNQMFSGAEAFNQDISNWDVSRVTDMSGMFSYTKFNQNIGKWDVSNVTTMVNMFAFATGFNQDLTKWCVKNVTAYDNFTYGNSVFIKANHPVWGTCPSD